MKGEKEFVREREGTWRGTEKKRERGFAARKPLLCQTFKKIGVITSTNICIQTLLD